MSQTFKTLSGKVRLPNICSGDLLKLVILCISLYIRADAKYNSVACITYP